MQSIAIILIVFVSFFMGVISLFGYMIWRMMRSDGWDDSNITNAQRVISHVVLHPEDLGRLYYLSDQERMTLEMMETYQDRPLRQRQPFWYVALDEFSEVVKSRPPNHQ
jgi:hypothetical protein